jgi:hypothetical protein
VTLATTLVCSNCGTGGTGTATLLAAIASILVALATLGVVVVTRRSARATEGILAAQLTPRLIDVERLQGAGRDPDPPEVYRQDVAPTTRVGEVVILRTAEGHALCSVPIRNVGAGLAYIRDVVLSIRLRGAIAPWIDANMVWNVSKRFVPVGEATRISVVINNRDTESLDAFEYMTTTMHGGILLKVRYSVDKADGPTLETRFSLAQPHGNWMVADRWFEDVPEYPRGRQDRLKRSASAAIAEWRKS